MPTKKSNPKSKTKKNFLLQRIQDWRFPLAVTLMVCAVAGSYFSYARQQTLQVRNKAQQLSQLVAVIPGVQVQAVGKALFLSGEVDSLKDWAKCRAAVNVFLAESPQGIPVGNLTRLSEAAKKSAVAQIRRDVRNRRVRVRVVGDRFLLEGTVLNDFDADKAVEVAKATLLLNAKSVTRDTAAEKNGETQNAFAPVLLDMLKTRS